MSLSAHIFCRVIDNYGDIGVAYRLARQLVSEHNWRVILWVDNLVALSRLLGESLKGLDICHWAEPFPKRIERGDVVIEAFACRVPDSVLQSMLGTGVVWLNLEYLSAEKWVEGSHALPSLHPTLPLTQHFFFPGFTRAPAVCSARPGCCSSAPSLCAATQNQPMSCGLASFATPPRQWRHGYPFWKEIPTKRG